MAYVYSAIALPRVVLPVPGGPQNITENICPNQAPFLMHFPLSQQGAPATTISQYCRPYPFCKGCFRFYLLFCHSYITINSSSIFPYRLFLFYMALGLSDQGLFSIFCCARLFFHLR
jgi:hypothetical protein